MGEETNSNATRDVSYEISSESLRIRLDTKEILDRIRMFLEGKYTQPIINEELGTVKYEEVSIGEPKANKQGLQSIMFWLESKLNAHMVQGNINTKQYNSYLRRTRSSLAENLMNNRINYGINKSDYSEIISNLMETLEIFLSRAINAGDRNSISKSSQHKEVHQTTEGRKKIGGIF